MDSLKKYFGIICLLAGAVLAVYLPYRTLVKLGSGTATSEDYIFWIVIVTIFTPIILGFILFGYYAFKGEYSDERLN
jgi:cytochrome bd-type quinol oxidase subunit 2